VLKLKANPTFKSKVEIPVPGEKPVTVEIEFKHMTRDALEEYLRGPDAEKRSYEDTVLGIACGWTGIDAPFSREALVELFQNYMGAPLAILAAYGRELGAARLGN
jgi:hypothetical protein